jgi:1,2-dihydroxy-3-keto-5-methylthiopentene dioxygenase
MHVVVYNQEGRVLHDARSLSASAALLAQYGVEVGHIDFDPAADPAQHPEVAALRQRYGVESSDRVTVRPGDPAWPALREKFLGEHTHADLEFRVFVEGRGLFQVSLPSLGQDLAVLAEAGDWISVPAGLAHRYDGGQVAEFDALRLFTRPDGWVADFTGAPAATPPLLDDFLAWAAASPAGAAASASADGRAAPAP